METKTNMVAKQVKYTCDDCVSGELVFTGVFNPRQNKTREHECTNCHEKVFLREEYPHVVYEEA